MTDNTPVRAARAPVRREDRVPGARVRVLIHAAGGGRWGTFRIEESERGGALLRVNLETGGSRARRRSARLDRKAPPGTLARISGDEYVVMASRPHELSLALRDEVDESLDWGDESEGAS